MAAPQPNHLNEVLAAMNRLVDMVGQLVQGNQHAPAPAPAPAPIAAPADAAPPAVPERVPPSPPALMDPVPLPPPPPLRQYRSSLPDFTKCNHYFDGNPGQPDKAEDWLAQIERSFAAFEVPQHLRVDYGTYMLCFRACILWESKRRDFVELVTWELFRRSFLTKFFLASLRVKYSVDFLHLSQGPID